MLVTLFSLGLILMVTLLNFGRNDKCHGTHLQNADPEQIDTYFTLRSQEVSPSTSRFLVQPDSQTCSPPPDLLVLVPSPPEATVVRETIRQTWGSAAQGSWPRVTLTGKVVVIFLAGWRLDETGDDVMRTARREATLHGDMLIGDFHDTYRNLTHKVLAGLGWVAQNCAGAAFVLKADQDTFVNVDELFNVLSNLLQQEQMNDAILGEMLCTEPVVRDPASPVWVDTASYPFSVYPPYVRGGSYVLSGTLVSRLVNASRYMPYLPVEDAFISGILGHVLNVRHVNLPRVLQFMPCRLSPCLFLAASPLTATDVDPDLMMNIWGAVRDGSLQCPWWIYMCAWVSNHI